MGTPALPVPDWLPAAAAAVLLPLGVLAGVALARWRARRRLGRHRRRGRAGEREAIRILERAGWRVLDTEVTATGLVVVDGEPREFTVRADAVVRRWLRRYVAEFKAGREAPSVANRATRRQLLEYARVFGVRGVLLVDAEAGEIHRVEFPTAR